MRRSGVTTRSTWTVTKEWRETAARGLEIQQRHGDWEDTAISACCVNSSSSSSLLPQARGRLGAERRMSTFMECRLMRAWVKPGEGGHVPLTRWVAMLLGMSLTRLRSCAP